MKMSTKIFLFGKQNGIFPPLTSNPLQRNLSYDVETPILLRISKIL
jgi:hypothetical protein